MSGASRLIVLNIVDVSPFWFFFTGKAHIQNGVKQWPGEVYSTPKGNITIHCHTHGDIQKAICLVRWYYERDGKHEDIEKLAQFSGRHSKEANHSSSSFTLTSLELNDTGTFHCNYICKIYGTYEQYYGNGTQLLVNFRTESVTPRSSLCTSSITGKRGQFSLCKLLVNSCGSFLFWDNFSFSLSCSLTRWSGGWIQIWPDFPLSCFNSFII